MTASRCSCSAPGRTSSIGVMSGGSADDPELAVDHSTELGERSDAVFRPRLGQVGLASASWPLRSSWPRTAARSRRRSAACTRRRCSASPRSAPSPRGTRARSPGRPSRRVALVEPEISSGDGEARRQPLDVPFERPRQRLVEIVDAEHEAAIRGSEEPEVREVRVAAQLSVQARSCAVREVCRHDVGRAAKERERRDEHSSVANRHQLRQTCSRLFLEQFDRVAADRGGLPGSVRRARHLRPRRLPARPPLCGGEGGCRLRLVRGKWLCPRNSVRCRARHDPPRLDRTMAFVLHPNRMTQRPQSIRSAGPPRAGRRGRRFAPGFERAPPAATEACVPSRPGEGRRHPRDRGCRETTARAGST